MKNFLRGLFGRSHVNRSKAKTDLTKRSRLRLQNLEDRTVPATLITILDSGIGTLDGFLSPTDGTITAADNPGIVGTLSRGALQGVNSNVNISITAEDAILFGNLTSTLALKTGAGNSASFAANTTAISFTDVTDGLSTAGGDVTITATTDATLGGIAANGGNIKLTAGKNISLNAAVATTGAGSIGINANTADIGGGLSTTAAGTLATSAGNITVTSNALMTIGGAVSSTGGGNVSISILSSLAVTTLNINAAITASGGAGSVFLNSPDHITVTAPILASGTGGIFIQADTDGVGGGTFTNSGLGTLTTAGNTIDITATNVSLGSNVDTTPGLGHVFLETQLAATPIHVGTNTGFGVTDAELGLITSGVVHIGGLVNTAGIVIDGAITRHAGFDTLTLQTDGGISQTAPLSVAKLAAQASSADLFLTNAGNDVDFLAGTANNIFDYVDANGFEVSGVDIRAGIFLGGAGTGDVVILQAGGWVTQTANEIIHTDNLLFLGAGSFAVNDPGNDAATFAASVTGSVSYTDSNGLKIGTVFAAGITTTNAPVTITASAQVSNTTLTISDAISTGGGAVTLSADVMVFNNTVNAGAGTATLEPTTAGREIDLGTNPSVGKLGLSLADVNQVTAGVVVIGSAAAGNISVTNLIQPTGTNQLELVTGGEIIDAHGGTDITVTRLGLTAGAGIGISAPNFELDTTVSNLEARTTTGGIVVSNSGPLTIGGVNGTLTGINVVTSGNVNINANGTITLTDTNGSETIRGGSTSGDISLSANGAASDVISTVDQDAITAPRGSITVIAGRDILFGTTGNFDNDVRASKDVTFNAGRDITIDGLSDIAADDFGQATGGNVLFTAGGDINVTDATGTDASVGNSGATGSVTLSAVNHVTLHAEVFTGGTGQISITYDSDNDFLGVFTTAAGGIIDTLGGAIDVHGGTDNKHGGLATLDANVTITGGSGGVLVDCAGDINVNAAMSVTGTGGIFISADSNKNTLGDFVNTAGGTLTTAGGVINITATDVSIGGTVNATTAPFADVFLQPSTNAAVIHLGTNTAFGVTDAELDLITAGAVIIGTGSNTGGIQLTGQVSLNPAQVKTLELLTDGTGGAITDNTAGEQSDITVQDLLLFADSGIGTGVGAPGDIDINVTNLSAHNTSSTAGAINLFNFSSTLNVSSASTGFFTAFGIFNDNVSAGTGPISIRGNGDINVQNTVLASGINDISIDALTAFTLDVSNSIKSGDAVAGGNIVIRSNVGNPNGTSDIILGANAKVLTRGSITLDVDPDANCVGGAINLGAGSDLAGPGGNLALNLTLRAGASDIVLTSLAANGLIDITTCGSILDDGDDTTFIQGASIHLTADLNIGGTTQISRDDVLLQNAAFEQAIDFRITIGVVTISQPGAGGNIQLRDVDGTFDSGIFNAGIYPTPVGVGHQLALIASGGAIAGTAAGDLSISNTLTLAAANNVNLLLAATDGNNVVLGVGGAQVTNNGATGTITVVADGAITDVNGANVTNITGGAVDLHADGASGITSDVDASISITAFTSDDPITLRSPGTMIVDVVNAGAGSVVLQAGSVATGIIKSVSPNDDVADAIGASVTLSTGGPTNGNTGQIGFFSGTAQFFEVNTNLLTASTNNSRLWVSEVGTGASAGTKINGVDAGTNTAFIRVRNGGVVTSNQIDNVPDIFAAAVNLTAPEGGGFGTSAASPLEIGAVTLSANVLTAAGSINVRDTAGGLSVTLAQSFDGDINLETAGATPNMSVTNVKAGGTGNVVLQSAGDLTIAGASTVAAGGKIDAFIGADATATVAGTITATSMTVSGSSGSEVFNITPSATTPINVDGNAPVPVAVPGDQLNVILAGTTSPNLSATLTANGLNGSYSFGNRSSVNFQEIETLSPGGPDLTITVTDGQASAIPGTKVSYTVVVTNNGPLDVTGASVVDTLPGTLTGVTFTATQSGGATGFTAAGNGAINDLVNMPIGSSVTYTVNGTINPSATGNLQVDASVALPGGLIDPTSANNIASDIDSLTPQADLNVDVSDSPDPVLGGFNLTYTVTVTTGPSDAQNVQLVNAVPANTTFVSLNGPAGWNAITPPVGSGGNITLSRATLPGGAAAQVFTIVVHVSSSTPNGTIINDIATATTSTTDPIPGNNQDNALTTVKTAVLPIVVGADAGGGPHVRVFDPVTGVETRSFFAYPGFGGGVRVAAGDINGDCIADIITAAGPGGGPHVKAFDGVTGAEILSFFAYDANFNGGVFVAVGDINGDGYGDIITGADSGGGPHVKVFSGQNGGLLASYFAYSANFTGGVRVAAGDVNGDGYSDIITGAGPTGGPHVTVRSGKDLFLLRSFFVYDAGVTNGVYVAGGDLNGDGFADIITGVGKGAPAHTIVYSGKDNSILQSFFAYDLGFTGGVRVAVADFNGDGQLDLITGAGPGGGPHVRVLEGKTMGQLNSFNAFDPSFMGGVFVG
ncbi:MAG: hypothetical protein ACJ8C4_19405 [Gemmataceae bacterium]